MSEVTVHRTCPLCEATCGLEIRVADGVVAGIRGDAQDAFSHGFVCPKGASLKALHEDPDRLRAPLIRGADGIHREATWEQAFALVDARLPRGDAVAAYLGNPSAHSLSALLYLRVLIKALQTKNVFSASTVDQMPKHVSAALMFGHPAAIPVPDVDRTDCLVMLGANPLVSNGSLLTAPDMRGRLRALRARGGTLVVIDPRRTRTAELADRHLAIRPGTDALLLLAVLHELFAADAVAADDRFAGVEQVEALAAGFPPDAVAERCGTGAEDIRWLARQLGAARRAAVYGRIGTCTQQFGTLASWLVDVLNALTGNLDRPGGAMFPRPAATAPRASRPWSMGRWRSRVRGAEEVLGEFPVACLAEEIETPGEGQVRALVTVAGNPVLSTPGGARLDAALATLDFMVAIDFYLNETTRHADVILPPPSPLERSHYDIALYGFAVRNVANYSPPVLARANGHPDEWEILLRVAAGPDAQLDAVDAMVAGELARRLPGDTAPDPALRGPERLLDLLLRAGPYEGLSLQALLDAPHGVDLGPLEPRLEQVLATASGRVELAPERLLADAERLRAELDAPAPNGDLVLVGRRDLRSNNSWMHNLPILVRGPERCTVHVHPDDAQRLELTDGAPARVASSAGAIELPVEVTDRIRPGVVSVPHGWGHDAPGARLGVAAARPGANVNLLADGSMDPVSGNAVLSGIPVEVVPVATLSAATG